MKFGISTLSGNKLDCPYAIIGTADGREFELPLMFESLFEWGDAYSKIDFPVSLEEISYLDIAWKNSGDENYFKFKLEDFSNIIQKKLNNSDSSPDSLVVGISSDGFLAIWAELSGDRVLCYSSDVKVTDPMLQKLSVDIETAENTKQRMFACVYNINVRTTIKSEIRRIRMNCFDGSITNYRDRDNIPYNSFGVPHRIKVDFMRDSIIYQIFIWFNLQNIYSIFQRFYGAHPETRADFIIRIDAENKKYELALFRQGLKEPVVIPSEAYQLIVFRNKFEDYRSKNYNQPRGAWIW